MPELALVFEPKGCKEHNWGMEEDLQRGKHSSLGSLTPSEFAEKQEEKEEALCA